MVLEMAIRKNLNECEIQTDEVGNLEYTKMSPNEVIQL